MVSVENFVKSNVFTKLSYTLYGKFDIFPNCFHKEGGVHL